MRSDDGFTLIELLVVILIIGILSAIALPSFLNQQKQAKAADAKETASLALRAIEGYGVENGGYQGVTASALVAQQPALSEASRQGRLLVSGTSSSGPDKTTYVVGIRAKGDNGAYFAYYHDAATGTRRLCSPGGSPGCGAKIAGLSFPGYGSVGSW